MAKDLCILLRAILLVFGFQFSESAIAQDTVSVHYDTSYITTFSDQLVLRAYYSRKFTGFYVSYSDILDDHVFHYEPNTTRNIGIGASYQWATLNLAYGFGFLNQTENRGKTKYLDLQSHLYLGKYNIDLLGQFYKGYYLKNGEYPSGEIYLRPDLNVTELGASVQYVFNHRKYSFKAAFQNTELQKKSAGSWLLGWDAFYGSITADSSLVPGYSQVDSPDFDRLRFLKTGPAGGYAYTLVFCKHFYLTGSASIALNTGVYSLKSRDVKSDDIFIGLDFGLRLAAGYNTNRLNIGALFVEQSVQTEKNYRNIVSTGNLRFIVAYRFNKKIKASIFP